MKTKSDSKKRPSKNLRAALSPGEKRRGKSPVVKKAKVRRDKYRSFSVTDAENKSMPALAKKAGYDDVARWLRFVSLGIKD